MKFRLRRDKPVHRTIGKLFASHVARCQSLLTGRDDPEPGRIHEARKSVKRLRALVSLVRYDLGKHARWFDRRLRDVNRTLSDIRDAHALREAMDHLVTSDADVPDDFAQVRARLLAWTDQRERLSPEAGESVVRQLNDIAERWNQMRLRERGWSLLEENIRSAYRDARKSALKISASAPIQGFHELRKLVKVTQYHWEFLEPMWPDRLHAELCAYESLTETLGRLHDALLLETWLDHPHQATLPPETKLRVLRRLRQQQVELQRQACELAPRCFAEKPRSVCQRMQHYWRSWRRDQNEPPLPATSHAPSGVLSTV
jgi:CHAD domain-containing protein